MRKVLLSVACLATIGLASARADVSYTYVTDLPNYSGVGGPNVNGVTKVSVFLQETVTGASTSIIFQDGGLFGAGVLVSRLSGDAILTNFSQQVARTPTTDIGNVLLLNQTPSPTGFGGVVDNGDGTFGPKAPTQFSKAPQSNSAAGIVEDADTTANAASSGSQQGGPLVPAPGTAGVYKILLGTLNVKAGTTLTTFQVTNYGAHGDTITQAKTDLDFSGNGTVDINGNPKGYTYTGASANPFFTFTVGTAVPEPSSMALCGLIASGMSYAGYRRRKATASEPATVA